MESSTIVLLVILGIAVIVVLWLVAIYNGLVRLRNAVKEAWSQIDVQLKRRHDLIPNLLETVKGYAAHEKTTLDAVVKARSQAVQATDVGDKIKAEQELSGALGRLMVVVEQYPDLKANQNFLALQEELTSTENKIGFSRQHYNESVMQYNTQVQSFPPNVVASAFGFKEEAFFELEDKAEREVPKVQF
jgi:LemA protein